MGADDFSKTIQSERACSKGKSHSQKGSGRTRRRKLIHAGDLTIDKETYTAAKRHAGNERNRIQTSSFLLKKESFTVSSFLMLCEMEMPLLNPEQLICI